MPMLPFIDLFIVFGSTMLALGAALKVIYITTSYRPAVFTFTPMDCLFAGSVFLLFALTLAARSWVKANEPATLAAQRGASTLKAYKATQEKVQRAEQRGVEGS